MIIWKALIVSCIYITIGILMFHTSQFLSGALIGIGFLSMVLSIALPWIMRDAFKGLNIVRGDVDG